MSHRCTLIVGRVMPAPQARSGVLNDTSMAASGNGTSLRKNFSSAESTDWINPDPPHGSLVPPLVLVLSPTQRAARQKPLPTAEDTTHMRASIARLVTNCAGNIWACTWAIAT